MKTKLIYFIHNYGVPVFFLAMGILLIGISTWVIYVDNLLHNKVTEFNSELKHWETSPDLTTDMGIYAICHAGIRYYIVLTEQDTYTLVDALTETGDIVTCTEE